VVQAIDSVEIYRDMLSTMLDLYLSSVSNRMNEIMKVLTIIATIFMPLTFLAGVYGMNFKHMPELEWKYGYLYAWIIMAGIGIAMGFYFKKKKWICTSRQKKPVNKTTSSIGSPGQPLYDYRLTTVCRSRLASFINISSSPGTLSSSHRPFGPGPETPP
jgi:hypothetical protein